MPDAAGYMRVELCVNKVRKCCYVHRLVAQAFIPNPEGKKEVHHIDSNRANNALSNLMWVTRIENEHYKRVE